MVIISDGTKIVLTFSALVCGFLASLSPSRKKAERTESRAAPRAYEFFVRRTSHDGPRPGVVVGDSYIINGSVKTVDLLYKSEMGGD